MGGEADAEACFAVALRCDAGHAPARLGLARAREARGDFAGAASMLLAGGAHMQAPELLSAAGALAERRGASADARRLLAASACVALRRPKAEDEGESQALRSAAAPALGMPVGAEAYLVAWANFESRQGRHEAARKVLGYAARRLAPRRERELDGGYVEAQASSVEGASQGAELASRGAAARAVVVVEPRELMLHEGDADIGVVAGTSARGRALGRVLSAWAGVERRAGRGRAARRLYRAAAEAAGGSDPRVWTAWARHEMGAMRRGDAARAAGARALLGRALALDGANAQALHALAKLERGGGDAQASEKALRVLAAAHPDSPYAWHALAAALRRTGDAVGARECLLRGLECGAATAKPGVRGVAAACALELAGYAALPDEAGALYERAAALEAGHGSPRALLAWAAAKADAGDAEGADALYERAAGGQSADAWMAWAAHARRTRGAATARTLHARGAAALPQSARLWAAWASQEDDDGDSDGARELLVRGAQACCEANDGKAAARLWTSAGLLAARDGYAVEARAAFRGALEAGGGEYVPALRGWAQLESDCGNGRRWKKLKKQLSAALGAQHGEAKSPVIFKKLAARAP